ncbi:MAG: glycosyltransferase [Cyanobacteriota bacterium]|jgi:glycosyltransferase involved in cell wall biosynthesis
MISFLIVVPTLNSHHLLPTLVQSLTEQTFNDWRVLFVDGPSNQAHRQWLQDLSQQDSRFQWEKQIHTDAGIFGAMNQGITHADANKDWILFWGSDDLAASPKVFEYLASKLDQLRLDNALPDLYVCTGIYYHRESGPSNDASFTLGRKTSFRYRRSYRSSLFSGSTPPHQATLFGPGAIKKLSMFDAELRLAADLDYFLRLSRDPKIHILIDGLELVWLGDSGISGKETRRRLKEVRLAYTRAFAMIWWIPFLLRYKERIRSLLFPA